MIERIFIKGFRAIRNLHIDDIRQFNLFIGRNGSGKTTILEAVSAILNSGNPDWLVHLSTWRDFPTATSGSTEGLASFFPMLDTSNPIAIDAHCTSPDVRDVTMSVEAIPGDLGDRVVQATDGESSVSESPDPIAVAGQLAGITCVRTESGKDHARREWNLQLNPNGYKISTNGKGSASMSAFHVHARRATSLGETSRLLTELYATRRHGRFIDAMHRFDPRVTNMVPGTHQRSPTVLVDIGLDRMVPMNVMGDGFCRVALMLTGALAGKSKALVVDEVDSGLHHTVMGDFWRSMIELSKQLDLQMFCTTHNEEMLRNTIDAFEQCPEKLRVFRVEREQDDAMHVESYDHQMLQQADLAGMDVR